MELWKDGNLFCCLAGNEFMAKEQERQRRIALREDISLVLPLRGDGLGQRRIMKTRVADAINRLVLVLQEGLSPTSLSGSGRVLDESIIRLRRFRGTESPLSYRYVNETAVIYVFVNPDLPVFEAEGLERKDRDLFSCTSDGVVLRGMVPPDQIRGITISPLFFTDAYFGCWGKIKRNAIPVYAHDGQCLWPQQNR